MNRRSLLCRCGVAAAAALAGCLGGSEGTDSSGSPSTDATTATPTSSTAGATTAGEPAAGDRTSSATTEATPTPTTEGDRTSTTPGTTTDTSTAPDLGPPSLGAADRASAEVVVKFWEDFRCPHCATFSLEVLPRLRAEYAGDRVRLEHHDFPIPIDRWSWRVALAARSVQDREGVAAFWTFAEEAFARQRSMDDATALEEVATTAGADPDAILADVDRGRHMPVLRADREAGASAGVQGTPAVFVDGGAVDNSYDAIASAIEAGL